MAEQGLWNIGGINLPDFGISEALGVGPKNAAVAPSYGKLGNQGTGLTGSNGQPYSIPGTISKGPNVAGQVDTAFKSGGVSNNTLGAASTNSGGSGGSRPTINTEEDAIAAGFRGLQDAINAGAVEQNNLINEAYGASAGYLNQAEDALRKDYPTILSEIDSQLQSGIRQADTGKASTLGQIQEQQTMADQRNQNVMADARRLYDELTRGYAQRFGGASSAGLAASELAAVERQRQQGKIQQDYGNTVRQIESAKTQVEQKYQEQLFQLEETKKTAVNEANRDFQNKLLQISQSRAENEQAKAQARLGALQDLRNKIYQINVQNLQFQQTLQLQKQQADSSLQSYASQLGDVSSNTANTTSQFNPNVTSSLQTSTNTTGSNNPYVGSIASGKNPLDELNLVGSISPTRKTLLG